MNAQTEIIPCLLCGANSPQLIFEAPDRLMKGEGLFRVVRCTTCGLTYLSPRPTREAITAYYPEDYEPYLRVAPRNLPVLRYWLINYGLWKRSRPILKYKREGQVLDIGCATGQFLAFLQETGRWRVSGVEPSLIAAQYARQTFALEVHNGDLKSAHYQDNQFDIVTMWDVLEHLHDPHADLSEIHRILKPDGILLFRVPSLESLDARIFKRYWAGLDVPRHMLVFDRKTLTRMLAATGFQPKRIWCASGSFFAFVLSWRILIDDKVKSSVLRRVLIAGFSNIIFRALSAPYFWIIDKLGYGASITVIAQPTGKA